MSACVAALGPEGFGAYAVDWSAGAPHFSRSDEPADGLLVPGFVDTHIHGGFGVDLMSSSMAEMDRLSRELDQVGYEGYLPTTVTASAHDVQAALKNLPDDPMVLGFHLEGPFISPQHPGAQPPDSILSPPCGLSPWDEILDDPRLKIVTMAPEQPGGLELVRRLAGRGVAVSIGHTDATYEQVVEAVGAGASRATHTYNAMRGMHHREPGTVGAVLTIDSISAELIYDRHHVHRASADVLIRCKGLRGVVAVSDSTAATGLADGTRISMWGQDCVKTGDSVRLASNGALAGSAVTLLDCFRNLYDDFGPDAAIRACSLNPRATLGMTSQPKTWLRFGKGLALEEVRRV